MRRSKLKSILLGILSIALVAAGPAVVAAKTDNGNSNAQNKVTICHATGSSTNPFVVITPNVNGIINGHQAHQDERDIIPPFTYNDHGTTKSFPGQNWDANGQAILNNNCKPTGGQGGQVLGGVTSGQSAAQVQGVQGGVSAGAGGASSFSLSSLQRVW